MLEADAFVVAIADLRQALERVLDAVEKQFGPVVDLAADYYWTVSPDETYALDMPTALHAGQLSDDVVELQDLLAREHGGEVFIWHDLEHLVGILQRIASLDTPPSRPPD
jgi:hypothetical protein